MQRKWYAMLPVKKQVDNNTCQIQQQFNGSLQHEHPAKSLGLGCYGFHYPKVGCTSYQPHETNAYYTTGKAIGFKNRRKKQLRNGSYDGKYNQIVDKKLFKFFPHFYRLFK